MKESRKMFLKYTEKKTSNTTCYFKYFIQGALWCATTATSQYLAQTYLGVICDKKFYETVTCLNHFLSPNLDEVLCKDLV